MKIIELKLGCALLTPKIIKDQRGEFIVPFSDTDLHKLNLSWMKTYQLNHSFTKEKGVIRGPNYQEDPYSQAKVIRCVRGSIYSVGICLKGVNKGKFVGYVLSDLGKELMYIPRCYAHGLITLEANTEIEYLTDNEYNYTAAKAIKWDDLGIDWTVGGLVKIREELLSEKNSHAPSIWKDKM